MNREDKKLEQLKFFYRMTEAELLNYWESFLKRKNYKKVVRGDFGIYAIGDIPVACAFHSDTVFQHPPQNFYYDKEQDVMWCGEGVGLGADDRNGAYMVHRIIEDGYRPHVIICVQEEVGLIGSSKLAAMPCPFPELKYIIQIDRRGGDMEAVYYDCDNEAFENFVSAFGYHTEWGSCSDISNLCPAWGVGGVNTDAFYNREHTATEVCYPRRMELGIDAIKRMLSVAKDTPKFDYIERVYSYKSYSSKYYDDWWKDYPGEPATQRYFDSYECDCCGKLFDQSELIDVEDNNLLYSFCPDCFDTFCGYCGNCNKPYVLPVSRIDNGLCNSCNAMFMEPLESVGVDGRDC